MDVLRVAPEPVALPGAFGDALFERPVQLAIGPLALRELLRREPARGDVDRRADYPHNASGIVENGASLRGDPADDPVLAADRAVLDIIDGPRRGVGRGGVGGQHAPAVVPMQAGL